MVWPVVMVAVLSVVALREEMAPVAMVAVLLVVALREEMAPVALVAQTEVNKVQAKLEFD